MSLDYFYYLYIFFPVYHVCLYIFRRLHNCCKLHRAMPKWSSKNASLYLGWWYAINMVPRSGSFYNFQYELLYLSLSTTLYKICLFMLSLLTKKPRWFLVTKSLHAEFLLLPYATDLIWFRSWSFKLILERLVPVLLELTQHRWHRLDFPSYRSHKLVETCWEF